MCCGFDRFFFLNSPSCSDLAIGTLYFLTSGSGTTSSFPKPQPPAVSPEDVECVSSPGHHRRGSSNKSFKVYTRRGAGSGGSAAKKVEPSLKVSEVISKVKSIANRPVHSLPVFTDLPRLAFRSRIENNLPPSGLKKREMVQWMLEEACRLVEGDRKASCVSEFLSRNEWKDVEDRLWMKAAFEEAIGLDSSSANILKTINQSVIMPVLSISHHAYWNFLYFQGGDRD